MREGLAAIYQFRKVGYAVSRVIMETVRLFDFKSLSFDGDSDFFTIQKYHCALIFYWESGECHG